MKLPFVTRRHHNSIIKALTANLDVRAELIEALNRIINTQRGEIKALKLTLEGRKCNDYTQPTPEKPKMRDPVITGRSGWRTRAELASAATIPAPKDSAKALEAKVLKEGGTI